MKKLLFIVAGLFTMACASGSSRVKGTVTYLMPTIPNAPSKVLAGVTSSVKVPAFPLNVVGGIDFPVTGKQKAPVWKLVLVFPAK